MYESFDEAIDCPKGDIRLVEDLHSGLVYNELFKPEKMVYDRNYQNEQGGSYLFQEHLIGMTEIIKNTMGKKDLVEVGCGKGFFLEMLLKQGTDVTGFDPTYEGINPRIERRYFKAGLGIKAKGIILRHVLEHIQDPISFLMELKEANGGSGTIYIEVPCFDWICKNKAWFDVYYEHANYFRMSDFHRIFRNIIDSGIVFGGQYLYVVADLSSIELPVIDHLDRVVFPHDFLSKLSEGKMVNPLIIWGAASRGVIFSFLKSSAGGGVDICIDINPEKQGKFIPATGLRVLSPDEGMSKLSEGSTIHVMNSNYLEEVKKMSNYSFNYVSIDHDGI